ncbi:hypothetical protein WH43_15310 [Rheinheimera sp. KL1]|uniref:DUF423 domain-containing protein n=1 Tax=Rheinheimera sp. KL1 TaxID=1635005 RepID=UPI0006A9C83F|nr:hypothetical protein [Rheinheimera sp. KL1]KOO57417.1 hypothetical protein WH43_15310 [Rheinheimera sp. KL1]
MNVFWKINTSLAAFYGAVTVGSAAALMHLWRGTIATEQLAVLLSAGFILAFHVVALLALLALSAFDKLHQQSPWLSRICACAMHIGLWLFVYTLVAGVFKLPLHFSALAPLGGQLLILSWLALAISPWIRK